MIPTVEFIDFRVPDVTPTISAREAALSALSTGYGSNPLDRAHLRYLDDREPVPVSTLANVVAHPGPWMKQAGVDWSRVVHAEQRLTIHEPVPIGISIRSRSRPLSIVDRGAGQGAFASFERILMPVGLEDPVATIVQTNACLGDGGCGSTGERPVPLPRVPERPADALMRIAGPDTAALLFRLNGDLNPLHFDPAAAAAGGFSRTILHGLCTFGYAAYAFAAALRPDTMVGPSSIARFSAPVFPGDALEFEIWSEDDGEVRFRGRVPPRAVTVLDCRTATL